MIFAAVFALIVGADRIGQWAVFLATGHVPESQTEHNGYSHRGQ